MQSNTIDGLPALMRGASMSAAIANKTKKVQTRLYPYLVSH